MAAVPRLSLPAGLRWLPDDRQAALRDSALAILGVTLFVVAIDLACGAALPADYRHFYTTPLVPRTALACLGALKEEVIYRLLLTTALAALPLLWRQQPGARWMIGAIVLAQMANVHPLITEVPPWGALRFWLVGCTWGWLYWRHGFVTALLAHGSVHLVLDPLLLVLLR